MATRFARVTVLVSAVLAALVPAVLAQPDQPPGETPGAERPAPTRQPEGDQQPADGQPAESPPSESQPTESQPTEGQGEQDRPAAQPDGAAPAAITAPAGPLDGLIAEEIGDDPTFAFTPLGSLDPQSPYLMEVAFSRYGAGVDAITLSRYVTRVRGQDHVVAQRTLAINGMGASPLALLGVTINTKAVATAYESGADALERRMWKQEGPGRFRARIVNGAGTPVLEIEREYVLDPDTYVVVVHQRVTNLLADITLRVTLQMYGPTDYAYKKDYGGDTRRVRYGFLSSPKQDPSRLLVIPDDRLQRHDSIIGRKKSEPLYEIWPTNTSIKRELQLSWIAQTSRYFGAAVMPTPADAATDRVLHVAASVQRVVLPSSSYSSYDASTSGLALRLRSEDMTISPGQTRTMDFAMYVGPLSPQIIRAQAGGAEMSLDGLVAYNYGGFCAICTFSWLTTPLIGLMRALHNYAVFDWALSIIVLVVIVRTILHPVTKWSQIRMQRFARQMQEIGPKQKKIQEKYKDDRQRMQQEIGKLWRDEGISPTGFLGCLPMFLQSPVWIALYATLFFAFELRHESAFFGVFQAIGGWPFLADLAQADRFIPLGVSIHIPLLSGMMGPIESINALPLLLGVVFYVHQKYMTPPPTASLSPEQEQQQKIIKVMMVVLFPLFMYNAPCGLSLYFVVNSTLGIIESRWIRAHMDKHDLLNPEKIRADRLAKPGLMGRLQKMAQRAQEQRAQQAQARQGPQIRGSRPEPPPQRFKKKR